MDRRHQRRVRRQNVYFSVVVFATLNRSLNLNLPALHRLKTKYLILNTLYSRTVFQLLVLPVVQLLPLKQGGTYNYSPPLLIERGSLLLWLLFDLPVWGFTELCRYLSFRAEDGNTAKSNVVNVRDSRHDAFLFLSVERIHGSLNSNCVCLFGAEQVACRCFCMQAMATFYGHNSTGPHGQD